MSEDRCAICSGELTWAHDHKPDESGLDDGVLLPGCAHRKKPPAKSADEFNRIRGQAWATRRKKYGAAGHR